MAKMKQLEINTNDTESPTGKSMRIGTGNTYIEIYDEVKHTHTHLIKLIFFRDRDGICDVCSERIEHY